MSSDESARPFDEMPEVVVPPEASRNPVAYLLGAAVEHGPIFRRRTTARLRARYGPWQVYLVGPAANRFVLHTHRASFSHAQGWRAYFGAVWNENLLYLDHEQHATHRKLMTPAFSPVALERYLPVMHRCVSEYTRDWGERGVVDVHAAMRALTFAVVAEALLDFPPGEPIAHLHALRDALCHNPAPFGKKVYYAHIQQGRAAMNGFLRDLLSRHMPEHEDDLVALLLAAQADPAMALSEDHLLGHLQVLLEAGHTTTMDTAMWVLGLLATHPAYLARVRTEVDGVLDKGDELTLERIKAMTVTGRAIDEAARLRTPVDTAPRGALTDFSFGGYQVPAGTFIRLHLGACHRLPDLFADPDRFDPDRFAPPREEQKRTPYAFAPFGGGPRVCIGMGFAQAEIKALVAHLVHTYDISPIAGMTPTNVYDTALLDDSLPGGLPLRFTPRQK